jgi:hypothetical protein
MCIGDGLNQDSFSVAMLQEYRLASQLGNNSNLSTTRNAKG